MLKSKPNSCSGFEGKFTLKVHALSAHVIYLAVRKGSAIFIFKQNRFIMVKTFAFSVVNRGFHSSPSIYQCVTRVKAEIGRLVHNGAQDHQRTTRNEEALSKPPGGFDSLMYIPLCGICQDLFY
jgi:hypothetical protein